MKKTTTKKTAAKRAAKKTAASQAFEKALEQFKKIDDMVAGSDAPPRISIPESGEPAFTADQLEEDDGYSDYGPLGEDVRVATLGGGSLSLEESDARDVGHSPEKLLDEPDAPLPLGMDEAIPPEPVSDAPVATQEPVLAPSRHIVPELPQEPENGSTAPQTLDAPKFTRAEVANCIEDLIDGLNHLYKLKPKRLLEKDIPILQKRVAQGRLLIQQLRF